MISDIEHDDRASIYGKLSHEIPEFFRKESCAKTVRLILGLLVQEFPMFKNIAKRALRCIPHQFGIIADEDIEP